MASQLARGSHAKVYLYHLDNMPSYHSVELNYVFGTPFIGGDVDEMGILNTRLFTEFDKQKSVMFMQMWVNFARYG